MKKLLVVISLLIALGSYARQQQESAKQLVHFSFTTAAEATKFSHSATSFFSVANNKALIVEVESNVLPISLKDVTPFLAVSLGWNEDRNIGAHNSVLHIRFSADEKNWSNWQKIEADEHSSNTQFQQVSQLIFTEKDYRFYQLKIQSNLLQQGKTIQQLMLNFFNPGNPAKLNNGSPSVDQNQSMFSPRTTACPCPQPTYVTRTGWNCPQGATSPSFTTVTHLIVHHSAGSNTSANWPAVVLSIWNSHVNTNGWSDIGYNWLIDPNGVLYEGRGGGNNVVGAHFCGFNGGTMGTCMLGTYTTQSISDTARKKLVEILAWKCCNSNLNPLTSAFHASSGLTINRISGHRDGCSTECPGNMTYNDLPNIRTAVNTYINDRCTATSVADIPGVESLTVSPNPTTGSFVIALKMNTGKPFRYALYDATGKQLFASATKQTGLRYTETVNALVKQPAGNYVLRIWIDKKDVTRNILKQ